jgi:5-methylcytosine-specific restriction endonuclease McrA
VPEDYSKLPKSRQEARDSGSLYYFTNKPCKRGHVDRRYVSSADCVSCNHSNVQTRREDPDNWQKEIEWQRTYGKTPAGRLLSKAKSAKRRAEKVAKTPKWANTAAIREFYSGCPEGFHVDHIIPLRNGVFPSVHSLENLQYLSAQENISKKNNVDPLSLRHYPCCVLPEYRSYVSPQSAGAFSGVLKFDPEDDKIKQTP